MEYRVLLHFARHTARQGGFLCCVVDTQRKPPFQQSGLKRGHSVQGSAIMNQPPSYPCDHADLGFHSFIMVHPPLVNTQSQRILPVSQKVFKHAHVRLLSFHLLPDASPLNT